MSLESKLQFRDRARAPRGSARVVLRKENTRKRAEEIASQFNLAILPALMIAARDIGDSLDLQHFLSPTLKDGLPDPREMKNLTPAASRIIEAVLNKDKIAVFSDFDVDGISSAAQLVPFLGEIGADVFHYAPNRFSEGYGLSKFAVEKLANVGTKLLITVDCGATSHEAVSFAKQKGLAVVVIDHHQLHGESPADILVDPAQEGCSFQKHQLCAAGLVWFLLVELRRQILELQSENKSFSITQVPDPKSFLDLAALGTICDMVPLIGPNRVIATRGIELLEREQRKGLTALKGVSKLSGRMSTGGVSFGLGPRINAAGRLADASFAFELLTTKDELRAQELAQMIDKLNSERRSIEEAVKLKCLDILGETHANLSGLAVFDPSFHAGVIGIVAQRLVEIFHKPAAVMALGEMLIGRKSISVIKGSVRSVKGFHVADALKALSSLLVNHGGHSEAGGFSIEQDKLREFQEAFSDLASRIITPENRIKNLMADAEISFDLIDFIGIEQLEKLQPFGIGNPGPVFVTNEVLVESVSVIAEKHLKVKVKEGQYSLTGLCWNFEGNELLRKGERVNIAYTPEFNSYQGTTTVQLNIKEVWSK